MKHSTTCFWISFLLPGADLGGGFRRCAPPPPPPRDDLWLSSTTGRLAFTSGHQSVTPFLSGAALLKKKILDPLLAPYISYCLFWFSLSEL